MDILYQLLLFCQYLFCKKLGQKSGEYAEYNAEQNINYRCQNTTAFYEICGFERKGGKGGEASAYSDFEKEYQFCVEVLIFCGGKGDYAYNECTEYVYYKCIYRKRVGIFYRNEAD